MEQQLGFCTTSDGVSIAYATVGKGPPLVKAANWLNHLEFDWESPIWGHLMRGLAENRHGQGRATGNRGACSAHHLLPSAPIEAALESPAWPARTIPL